MNPNTPIYYNPDGSTCPGGDECSGDCREKLRCARCDELFVPYRVRQWTEWIGPTDLYCESCIEDAAI